MVRLTNEPCLDGGLLGCHVREICSDECRKGGAPRAKTEERKQVQQLQKSFGQV